MDYINRDIENTLRQAGQYYAVVMLTGPRQVGKTTTLRRIVPEGCGYVTLDHMDERRIARQDPELFLSLHPAPLMIDEVQYAPELFSHIKIEVDSGAQPGSYWMTGSQEYSLMRLAQESLAGRAAILRMSSLSQHEIYGKGLCTPFYTDISEVMLRQAQGSQIDVVAQYERIWQGSMPGHVSGEYPDRHMFYQSYIRTYIDRDVSEEFGLEDKLLFQDFIRACACRAGQILNKHDLAGDVGITDDTANRWLSVLEKSGIIFYLRPYSNNLLKRTIKTPKMYFFETGLVAYLTKHLTADMLLNGPLNGAILENYVVAEIRKTFENNGLDMDIHFYRDRDKREIDLILNYDGTLHPIEIKKTASPSPMLIRAFSVLEKAQLPVGSGSVVCTKLTPSAIDRDNAIVPVWMI